VLAVREGKEQKAGKSVLDVPYFHQETDDSCASACLLMALAFRFRGRPIRESEVSERCRCHKGLGTTPADAFAAALSFELDTRLLDTTSLEAEVWQALSAGCPVVANVELRALPYVQPPDDPEEENWHSVLIIGMDADYVYLHDPHLRTEKGPRAIQRMPFFAGWVHHGHSAYQL
jgi:predicted double-glycine peptidase